MLPGQLRAHRLPHGEGQLPAKDAIRPGEVDVLEDAERPPAVGALVDCPHSIVVYGDGLPGLDLPHDLGAKMVEGAGLGGDNPPAVAEPAHAEGTDAQRIADGHEGVPGQHHQGVGSLGAPHQVLHPLAPVLAGSVGQQVGQGLGVGRCREDAAPVLKLRAEGAGVDDVPVMAEGKLAVRPVDEDRLGVAEQAGAGGGVPGVAYGDVTGEPLQVLLAEGLGHKAHGGVVFDSLAVADGYARALLAPVLKREEAKEGNSGYVIPRGVHPYNPTLLFGSIWGYIGCVPPPRRDFHRKGHFAQELPFFPGKSL